MTFKQVLTMYQIYHSLIHPPHPFSLILPTPHSQSSFTRHHFCIYLHRNTFYYTLFTLLPPFPQHLLPTTGASSPTIGRTCSTLLFSNLVEEKQIKEKMKNVTF
jgi:hypothetical protein